MVLLVDTQLFPTKESCLVEGQTPCSALLSKALTLVVPIRRSIPAFCVLECSGLFGGESCKKDDGTGACSLSRFPRPAC